MPFDFASLRASFFDTEKVLKAAGAARRKAFGKAGAFVRRRARSSIKRKKGSAPPGQPPHAHQGAIKLIFFAWDSRTESMVVGPVPFQAKGPKKGARLLEVGGEAQYQDGRGRPRRVRYRGNPTMVPAMMAEVPKFQGLFKGSLGG